MNLPVVPLQQDLAQVAALGIDHVERNGHHYVRGLDHLGEAERTGCEQVHSGLYRREGGVTRLDTRGGRIDLRSLQVPGLGVGVGVERGGGTEASAASTSVVVPVRSVASNSRLNVPLPPTFTSTERA